MFKKTIGFIVFSFKNVFKKQLVLLCFRSKMFKKSIGFIVKLQKNENTIGFTVKIVKKEQKPLEKQWFCFFKGRKTNFGRRIRAVKLQYSPGEVMRNPYRQAV